MGAGHEDEGMPALVPLPVLPEDALERVVFMGFRLWHVVFMAVAALTAIVVCVCCCVRFRIPRTKQEIEADFVRKKITRKFQKHLRLIQNAEMDEMDLKRALDRVRAEFRSETASLGEEGEGEGEGEGADDSVFNDDDDTHTHTTLTDGGRKRRDGGGGGGGGGDTNIDDMINNKKTGFGERISSLVDFLRWRRGHKRTRQSPPTAKLAV